MKKYFLVIVLFLVNIGLMRAQEQKDTTQVTQKGVFVQLEEELENMDNLFVNPNKRESKKGLKKSKQKKSEAKIIDFNTGVVNSGKSDDKYEPEKSLKKDNSLFISRENCRKDKYRKNRDEVHSLFGGGSNGFYVGADARLINYYDWKSTGMNFRMGWIKHHSFSMGMEGGFYGQFFEYNQVLETKTAVKTGYGGVAIEFAVFPKWPIHLTFPISSGLGIATLFQQKLEYSRYSSSNENYYLDAMGNSQYAYFQPGAQIEINLLRHLRLGFGLSYLYTTPIDLPYMPSNVLNYPVGNFSIKIGKF